MRKTIYTYVGLLILFVLSSSAVLFAQGNIPLLAQVNQYQNNGYNDCWGYTADGREYAFLGINGGTSILDITDTQNIAEVGFIPNQAILWGDMKTYQNYLYVVTDLTGNGMQIIDLSNLPNSVSLVSTYTGFTTSHNIYIDEATGIMLAEGSGGSQSVYVISLANPTSPNMLSSFGVECHDVFLQDNVAYISEGGNGSVGIYDLATPGSPSLLQRLFIPASGYSHNAWVNSDNTLMMTTEETTGKTVKVWDIANLNNITMTDDIIAPTQLAHNAHIKGDYGYVAHYADGLRIYDMTNPNNLSEAGFYDTYPGGGGGFVGAWGAYPFFDSNKVLISDMQTGLYIVEFDGGGTGGISVDATLSLDSGSGSGSFDFTMNFVNLSGAAVNSDLWLEVSGPGGYFDLVFVKNKTLGPTANVSKTRPYTIPGGEPTGTYDVTLYTGTHGGAIDDSDTQSYNKTSAPTEGASLAKDFGPGVIPNVIELHQNYPNPFNPSTTLRYGLNEGNHVTLVVYNSLGQQVKTLVNTYQSAGYHAVQWDGRNQFGQAVTSGIYLYKLHSGNVILTQKMLFSK